MSTFRRIRCELSSFEVEACLTPRSPGYLAWLDDHAASTYAAFLVLHPGFVIRTLWENADYFRSDFVQPYHKGQSTWNRMTLMGIGEALQPGIKRGLPA